MTWEPSVQDHLEGHALGIQLDACPHCHHFLCVCFENEIADNLNSENNHQRYDYE